MIVAVWKIFISTVLGLSTMVAPLSNRPDRRLSAPIPAQADLHSLHKVIFNSGCEMSGRTSPNRHCSEHPDEAECKYQAFIGNEPEAQTGKRPEIIFLLGASLLSWIGNRLGFATKELCI